MARSVFVDFQAVKKIDIFLVLEKFGIADQFEQCGDQEWKSCCPLPSHPLVPEAVREGHQRNCDQFKIKRNEHGEFEFFCHSRDHRVGGDLLSFIARMIEGDNAAVRQQRVRVADERSEEVPAAGY